ncbi:PREDICTED: cytochrome b-c1 complex subunit 2, mitochondrial [Nicrophorus vespilloides]|uniref:Cytochrome b-c1 complex subunit 2, mitochondrial n=1 Tax=Nicrophorus vespilloides TaxID=110193 RepID=A0ABM1MZ11_NICVS|nr:PREDICTED: cytochrome b-c1 complex subunit 2, mitochondrial [Nicrophorus vespilloides]
MASNLTKVTMLRAVQSRGFCQAAPIGGIANYDVQTSILPNKTVVASGENGSAICRVSVVFKAGSRNESFDNAGAAHVLRIAAGQSTSNATNFSIMRNIQQVGANLTCWANRENVGYTLEGTRNAVEQVMPFLTEVATKQVFKPWELSDNINRIKLELATRPPQLRAIDLLHKAAYRRGLGNSLYIAKHQIGKIGSETLQHYVASNFLSGRAAVIGVGVDHDSLAQYAQGLELETGDGHVEKSPYMGGEIRSDKGGNMAYFAIGTESVGYSDLKQGLAFAVLKCCLGNGTSAKPWGSESAAVLSKAVGEGEHAIAAFNVQYSDSGLFGVLGVAKAKDAGKLVEAAVKTLESGSVSDADVNRGKNQLKRRILTKLENGFKASYYFSEQALLRGEVLSSSDMAAAIESVTTEDVNQAAQAIAGKKLSIAAVGNLQSVPFLDQLTN